MGAVSGATQTAASQAAMTPARALRLLAEGNARFAAGQRLERDYLAEASATAAAQYPHSVVLACMDSRVPVEVVFDQGIGDVFAIRVAGNYASPGVLGALEYATALAGARLVVVLGHTGCGAIQAACAGTAMGHLTNVLAHFAPAIAAARRSGADPGGAAFAEAVTRAHVRVTAENIAGQSRVIGELVAAGTVRVAGALHDVATGRVTFFDR